MSLPSVQVHITVLSLRTGLELASANLSGQPDDVCFRRQNGRCFSDADCRFLILSEPATCPPGVAALTPAALADWEVCRCLGKGRK